jgi:hypothetical protein
MAASTTQNKPSRLLAEALDLAGRGWRIIPLHDVSVGLCSCGKPACGSPGKHPRTVNGLKDGTTDPATIRRWWPRWPSANVGVCTGPDSGVWMLGPDGQAGIDALAELERRHGQLPPTPAAKSGSGGRHYYFRWPAEGGIGNRKNHRGLPIDVRGQGGYFVAPPSRNKNGLYEWEIHPDKSALADAPQWLLDWCRSAGETSGGLRGRASRSASIADRAIAYLAALPPAISGHGGHDQTLAAARVVVYGFNVGPEVGFQLLWQHYNPRCDPPWSEKELRYKCEEADTVPFGKERGWLLNGELARTAASNGKATAQPKEKNALRPLPTYEPFPLETLPPTLHEYVDAAAAAIGCDTALVALPALAVAAGCIGNSRALRLKRGWAETAIVWAVTVAPSGALKSPAFAAAVDPLMAIQMEEVYKHQRGQEEYEREKKEWRKKARDERGDEPEEPKPEPCYVTTETTVECVGQLLRDTPRGLLLARDELDGWFQGFTRYRKAGATDRPHWLELSRAGTLRIHRVSRPPLSVCRACCSVTGTIQPAVLAPALDSAALAAGLGARFLMAMPPYARRRWTEAEVSEDLSARYTKLLRDLLDLKLENEATRKPHFLSLTPAAKAVWVDWFDRWGEKQAAAWDAEAAALAKLEGYAARLALVHSVVAHVVVEVEDIRPVGEQSIRAGIRLAEWFAGEAERVYAVLRESEDERRLRELFEWIEARGGETTVRAVQAGLRSRYPTSDDAKAALDELAGADLGDWLASTSGPRGGRPSERFRLRAHKTTKPPDPLENSPDLQGAEGFCGFVRAEDRNGEAHEQTAPHCREPGEEG